ncbi:MAG: 16S rRNA (adenine(1518)-N(6)/adenine(1519)-N(6))-dimethyltransferase RsmA [Saprospiraceae bacterium]
MIAKSYGQHFLNNENIAQKIAGEAIELSEKFPILEIGPGKGVLTKYLFEKSIRFMAVEADIDMVEFLQENFPDIDIHLMHMDFLKLDFETVFPNEEFVLFGNFPYNISSQILFKMIESRDRIPAMVGMFQKEVAERIVSPKGNKDYGILSVLTQAYYTGKILYKINPGSFSPPPKVDSAVIKLERKPELTLPCDEKLFKSIVKITFNQRRKMIRNTLKSLINDQEILQSDFFTLRPEQLSVSDFVNLTNTISEYKKHQIL